PPPPALSTLSLHDALPISDGGGPRASAARPAADARHADQGGRRDALHAGAAAATRPAHRRGADDAAQISGRATRGAPPRGSDRVDRKSTRLNSSHDQISYA